MLPQDEAAVVQDRAPVEQVEQGLRAGNCLSLPDEVVEVLVQPVDVSRGHEDVQRRVLRAQLRKALGDRMLLANTGSPAESDAALDGQTIEFEWCTASSEYFW